MTLRLAISGFGRIGRMTLRALQEMNRDDMEVVLINSPGPVEHQPISMNSTRFMAVLADR